MFLKTSFALVFLQVFVEISTSSIHKKRPNIVVFIADDLGWNDVSIRGSSEIFTPNIDSLALNGILFDKYYTQQSCTPSRSSFLTGQYPIRLGYQGFPINPGVKKSISHKFWTLPKGLKELGYSNYLIGKWHLGSGKRAWTPEGYGYDTHYGYWNGFIGYFDHQIRGSGLIGKDFVQNSKPVVNKTGQYFTDLLTKKAIDVIETQPKHKPMYMVVSHLAPHTGKNPNADFDGVLEVANKTETDEKYWYIKDEIRRMYAEIVEKMDDSIGQVIKALERKKMMDNTILVFFSDNGAPTNGLFANRGSNWPLRGIKLSLFEGAVRVPAMIYSSKFLNKGRIFKNLFHISDWAPTLYAAAGGDTSKLPKTDGIDQWNSLVFDKKQPNRQEILLNIDEEVAYSGLISYKGRYKLINNTLSSEHFNEFTGASGRNSGQPYKLNQVLTSDANKAISNTHSYIQTKKLMRLRNAATVPDCRNPGVSPPACKGVCVFDLINDPCETTDLSGKLPEVAEVLVKKLSEYKGELVPQLKDAFDPASNPKYCDGNWFNWLDQDGCLA